MLIFTPSFYIADISVIIWLYIFSGSDFMPVYKEGYFYEDLPHPLFVRQWLPDGEIFGLVQLCHGMAEHGNRYKRLGTYLAEHGYAAFCHDHRGHGKTCLDGETLGYFSPENGWRDLVDDTLAIGRIMRHEFCDGSFILFGHSMGSLVVSAVAESEDNMYDGFILCGSPSPNSMAPLGKALAEGFCKIGMAKKPNIVLHALAFADVNRFFKKDSSKNAWLSSDKQQVSKYDSDPLCGFHFTSRGFYDLFTGLIDVRSKSWAVRTQCKPFLLISGQDDPIGGYGNGVLWIRDRLKAAGRDVTCILYPKKRHEILNESDCGKVYTDIVSWILREVENG